MLQRLRYRLETPSGAAIGVEAGRVCDPSGRFDLSLRLGGEELRAGLINAHDHLHRNHFPRLGAPPYLDAYEWGHDIHARWADVIERGRAVPRRDAMLFGALKNLISGVTSVVHHDEWHPMFDDGFPLRVVRVRVAHSLGFDPGMGDAETGDPKLPLCVHLAEGTSRAMAEEVFALERLGHLDERLIAVHAVGVDSFGAERLRAARAAMIWCPTSNHFLLGRTASAELLGSGVEVLLGSDSLLTAEGTLLDELRAARHLGLLDDRTLLEAIGGAAARRLGLPTPTLASGRAADIVYLTHSPLEARCADVSLVIVGGAPRFGDVEFGELFEAAGVPTDALRVGGVEKLVVKPLGSVAMRIVEDWPEAGRILR